MVPYNPAASRRVLLPAEAELCNVLGLSEEEYWYFVELTDAYNGKRDEAYELAGVPDAQNGFLVPILINLVIGIALSALGALLAPKPAAPKTPPQLKTADVTGAKRYTSTTGFDSAQDLASLGETIPLVFANRRNGSGGVRVKTMLLWSQLLSYGTGQQLKALMLLSAGELAAAPDFAGYAVGDQTLKNYASAKVALYFRAMGGRIQEGNRYGEGTLEANPVGDVFTVYDDTSESFQPWFCGNRTTSTQTQFGCFSPMPNGTPYRLAYELILTPNNTDARIAAEYQVKRDKLNRDWSSRAALTFNNGTNCVYTLSGGQEDPKAYDPWGLDDVNNSTEERRSTADDSLQVGSMYMAGTAQVVLTSASTDQVWLSGMQKTYTFKVETPGEIPTYNPDGANNPSYGLVLQRFAVGTVANNRACYVTEIGLKSTVWKQMNSFPNVNSQPDDATIKYYEDKGGSIQLGYVNRYHKRYSFFYLEARRLGTGEGWRGISGGSLFCVKGVSPQAQYNFLRIAQPFGQWEYRFVPYPGAAVIKYWLGRSVYLLNPGSLRRYTDNGFVVTFTGDTIRLSASLLTNADWKVGGAPNTRGTVIGTGHNSDGLPRPTYQGWAMAEQRWKPGTDFGLPTSRGYWDRRIVWYGETWRRGPRVPTSSGEQYYIQRWEFRTLEQPPSGQVDVGVSASSGGGAVVRATQWSNGHVEWGLVAGGLGYANGDTGYFNAFGRSFQTTLITDEQGVVENTLNIFDAAADIGKYDAERFSHEDNPEHEIVYINEIMRQSAAPQYDQLAVVGLRLNASKEWANFQQLSAYVKHGIKVDRLIDDNGNPVAGQWGPTNNFAEIAYTLLTDARLGAGGILGASATNRERMTQAARFCRANGFTWDGVIGEKLNLREFIFEQAGYCLLDFTILGGQFSLVPSVPVRGDGAIDHGAKPQISALFTDGNIRDLKVSWLSPEERQLFKVVVKWREETENGFPQERVYAARLSDAQGGSDSDPQESFDMSSFCTSQVQVQAFAAYALKLRKEVDHGLKFETTPQAAMGLEPGAYFRLVSEVTHTSRFNNGAINSEGLITSTTTMADGTYNVLTWQPGTVGVSEDTLVVQDGKAQESGLFGRVFTLKNSTTSSRVYKVESLSYGQEGFVEIAGSYQPLTASGALATLDWSDEHFVVEVG